jgi:uncharacterized repeat protein (TIGR03803 family)
MNTNRFAKIVAKNAVFVTGLLFIATAVMSYAQTYATLASFGWDAQSGPLIQGPNGNFYGVTEFSGAGSFCIAANRCGMVFQVTPAGTLTTLYNFCSVANCADGSNPQGSLLLAPNGNFYGTTSGGGANCVGVGGCGTVFELTPAGSLTTLYSFCASAYCRDGDDPAMGLALGPNGNLYGSTRLGGANCLKIHGCGTIFEITLAGQLTTIYNFCPEDKCAEGADPNQLLLGSDGNFYDTTQASGTHCSSGECGTVFQLTPTGTLTILHAFCSEANCADGMRPIAGLVQASNGNFYGTTAAGGANCSYFGGCGTVFEITAAGQLTTIYNFCPERKLPCVDGFRPFGALIQASDGNLYGTTSAGGNNGSVSGSGTIFRSTLTGGLETLYDFCSQSNCADGSTSESAVVQGSDGSFYGTTIFGGANGGGTVYKLSID